MIDLFKLVKKLEIEKKLELLALKYALQIEKFVEIFATILKKRELKGVGKFFFKNGRLVFEFWIEQFGIHMIYVFIENGISKQVTGIATDSGAIFDFNASYFLLATSTTFSALLTSIFITRSMKQQNKDLITSNQLDDMLEAVNKKRKYDVKIIYVPKPTRIYVANKPRVQMKVSDKFIPSNYLREQDV